MPPHATSFTLSLSILQIFTKNVFSEKPTEFQVASLIKQLVEQETDASMITKLYDDRLAEEYQAYPFGQIELIASDCTQTPGDEKSGSLLIFASPLTNTLDSVLNHENNCTFDVTDTKSNRTLQNPMMRHRVSLLGSLEMDLPKKIGNSSEPGYEEISECFFVKNPIGRMWEPLPDFKFYRFVPSQMHYVGGFGGSHYIGWIDLEKYRYAPNSGRCEDWGDDCVATGEELCCPMDLDNDMHGCCQKFEDGFDFGGEQVVTEEVNTEKATTEEMVTISVITEVSSALRFAASALIFIFSVI